MVVDGEGLFGSVITQVDTWVEAGLVDTKPAIVVARVVGGAEVVTTSKKR